MSARLVELAALAASPAGRRYLARTLADLHVLGSVYTQNAGIYRMAGLQEQGLSMLRELHEASPGAALAVLEMILQGEDL